MEAKLGAKLILSRINSDSSHLATVRLREQQRTKAQTDKESVNNKVIDEGAQDNADLFVIDADSANELISRASQAVDESLLASSQFRTRRDLSVKSGADTENNFDSILEENTVHKIAQLLKFISGVEGNSIRDILFKFMKLFPDESDRVKLLRKLLAKKNIDEATKSTLKILLESIEKEAEPKRLKAGINVAMKALLFGRSLGVSSSLLRNCYRDFLETNKNETHIYLYWITLFGYKKRKAILKFVESALLIDIDSMDPSCSLVEFGQVLARLSQLKKLRTVDESFIKVLLRAANYRDLNQGEEDCLLFLFCILTDAEKVKDYLYELLCKSTLVNEDKRRVILVQIVCNLCKCLPIEFFENVEDKELLAKKLDETLAFHFNSEVTKKHHLQQ
ncbi:type III secretion system gatekeeper subunit SctW [Rouxiella silvae]|uniref:Type III secretion system gatekeeper subunit SctW n=1 Tax=Rouxiella silvae TaxID=1646373 RepID=A0AA40X2Z8_9GAMM|nr:type III secretion system gatekeeper subunit SctW [Rouxiella silvae]MBF6637706.1 type III secretion system gatekeeper subunit SctW [Rouxiella silvae]